MKKILKNIYIEHESAKKEKSNTSNESIGIIEFVIILLQTFRYNLYFTFKKTFKRS